jgi:LacI family transcriptional regulator
MGGGNRAILAALEAVKCGPQIYIGHDLDTENRTLLRRGHIHFLLEHDLKRDMARAFDTITAQHRLNPIPREPELADVQILTPAHFS